MVCSGLSAGLSGKYPIKMSDMSPVRTNHPPTPLPISSETVKL
jgi:hypothetical protein